MPDALISIKPQFVEKMISGQKTVEIRTRKVQLEKNSKLWIYTTLPRASVQMVTLVKYIEIGHPKAIWNKHRTSVGISKQNFEEYVNGSEIISAIVIEKTRELPFDISLYRLRSIVPSFHPPQFIKHMNKNDPVLLAILKIISENPYSSEQQCPALDL